MNNILVYKVHISLSDYDNSVVYNVIERFHGLIFNKKDFRDGRYDDGKYTFFDKTHINLWTNKLRESVDEFDLIKKRDEIINKIVNDENKN